MVLGIWSALRLPLALDKAAKGPTATWTSACFKPVKGGIEVTVKPSIVDETVAMLRQFCKGNYVARKALRQCVGKATHIASLIHMLRPFLTELYGALYSKSLAAGADAVWVKQIRSSMTWILALLESKPADLKRTSC